MPEYSGIIKGSALKCTRMDLLAKWIGKHEDQWFRMTLELIGKHADPKTAEQLGYYFGLLVPEIMEQLNADKNTITISAFGIHAERPYFKEDTHEPLTQLCNHVGKDGALMRLSDDDMSVTLMRIVIDNVLNFATQMLRMNGDKLKAWQPE